MKLPPSFSLVPHASPNGEIPIIQIEQWRSFGQFSHGFSTRVGGVSKGPWENLNLSDATGDDGNRVMRNRNLLIEATRTSPYPWLTLKQVHGTKIEVNPQAAFENEPEADGFVSRNPGTVMAVKTADCVPILLVCPYPRMAGAIHAGWRGTAAGIAAKAVETMKEAFNASPMNLLAAIGPSIGPCCFEVDHDTANSFPQECREERHGKTYLDLWKANRIQLAKAGLSQSRVFCAEVCTACHPEWFYSHRRDNGKTGRMLSWIGWQAPEAGME